MCIVVAGGSGKLGLETLRQLIAAGHEVYNVDRTLPRESLCSFWVDTPRGPDLKRGSGGPVSDGSVGAQNLCGRLAAIKKALEGIPAQAKRLARWEARRRAMERPKFTDPRKQPNHEVDHVLIGCDSLARYALKLAVGNLWTICFPDNPSRPAVWSRARARKPRGPIASYSVKKRPPHGP
jgi:NAD(P)-dependent dehydrogenase (short-subunit alcohol dehydrogenase family)